MEDERFGRHQEKQYEQHHDRPAVLVVGELVLLRASL